MHLDTWVILRPAGTIYNTYTNIRLRAHTRTHTPSLSLSPSFYLSLYLSIYLSLALTDKRTKIAEIILRWKWCIFCTLHTYIATCARAHINTHTHTHTHICKYHICPSFISTLPSLRFSFPQTNVTRTKVLAHTVNCRHGKDNVKASLHSSPAWIFL